MKLFPKKYKPSDLHDWSRSYREEKKMKESEVLGLAPVLLSVSDRISYDDFFMIYLRDFFNCMEELENSKMLGSHHSQNLFLISNNQFKNISSSFSFFCKRNQTLPQVWVNKLEKHIQSVIKKNLNVSNRIINANFSSPHKFLMVDSAIYLYIAEHFRSLCEKWKILKQTDISYRSFNLQCSIPNDHIVRKDEVTNRYTLKYFIWSKCEALPIILDDIDLCCGDVGILVHPKDKRYNKHIWKKAIIPLSNRQIPVIGDENVNIAQNNWIKRICPCSDQESINLARKYWLPMDVYVFNKEWLYTDYIHEKAFIGQARNKYYKNIEWFMWDIWNLTEKEEVVKKVPYLKYTNETLVPLKTDQFIIDIKDEKQRLLSEIFEKKLHFSFIVDKFWNIFDEIDEIENKIKSVKFEEYNKPENNLEEWNSDDELSILEKSREDLRNKIINEINEYVPDYIVCNSQLPYWWKVPILFGSDWDFSFFDLENHFFGWKSISIQNCFDFVLLSLVRIWVLWNKWFGDKKNDLLKICEYEKIFQIFSQNEKKIYYFLQELSEKIWEKSEISDLLKIFQNLTDENNSTIKDCRKLIDDSKFLIKEWNWLLLNFQWICDDVLEPDFVQSCVPCYIEDNWYSRITSKVVYDQYERRRIFSEIIIQYLFLWKSISDEFLEISYNKENEFLWEKELSKLQFEQSQWDMFNMYWENPVRLGFLLNKTYDQKEILLNSIFLKQVWNAVRLCIGDGFIVQDVEKVLSEEKEDFDKFDLFVLYKLNELYDDWENVKTFDSYIEFFKKFKLSVQDLFFSWYLEIQKLQKTKDVEFVCTYFFNFLLTILYPLAPEFVDALCYVSKKNFVAPFGRVSLNKAIDYNTNLIYDVFVKIKKLKVNCDIKQHEYCSIFIKSSPTLWDLLRQYEQIFKTYFRVSDVIYLRLHEQNLLWYEVDSDDVISIWIKVSDESIDTGKETIESLENEIKHLEDKLQLIRERMQILWEWEQYLQAEQEYKKVKQEMENLSIKHSLLRNK